MLVSCLVLESPVSELAPRESDLVCRTHSSLLAADTLPGQCGTRSSRGPLEVTVWPCEQVPLALLVVPQQGSVAAGGACMVATVEYFHRC